MSEANSMSATWCAARVAEIRAHVNNPDDWVPYQTYRTWLIELLSQLDNPPENATLATQLQQAREELAEQAARTSALLAEFAAGIQPADIAGCLAAHSEPAFGEFLRGANSVHATNLRWVRWKAAEFGLPWPLPAAEFEFGYTNEAGQPEPFPTPAPLAGEAGPAGEPNTSMPTTEPQTYRDYLAKAIASGSTRVTEKEWKKQQKLAARAPQEREGKEGEQHG